ELRGPDPSGRLLLEVRAQMRSARAFALVLALAALAAPAAAPDTSTVTNPKTFFWAPGQSPTGTVASVTNDIIYHGGNAGPGAIGIQKTPAVCLIYWGTEWANGFTTADTNGKLYSSKTLQNYLNTFMANLGGSP